MNDEQIRSWLTDLRDRQIRIERRLAALQTLIVGIVAIAVGGAVMWLADRDVPSGTTMQEVTKWLVAAAIAAGIGWALVRFYGYPEPPPD